jgi:dTDP-4-dehydrorhamnose reductase
VTRQAGATVLVTGAGGQLGRELLATVPPGWTAVGCTSAELDITHPERVDEVLTHHRPAIVINAAAYTAVDAAEREAERAEAVNSRGAGHVAECARRIGARLVHVSTDFVFDGSQARPYAPEDHPHPLGVYGRTKLAGEREVVRLSGGDAIVLRTAWLYSPHGRNFLFTMLRLMRERDEVRVVTDQVGTPTSCHSLAEAIWAAAARPRVRGVHHWTDAGVASWYDFAVAIQEEALAAGLLERAVPVRPIRTEEYPTPARRPAYSVLDSAATAAALGVARRHWRVNLRAVFGALTGD